MWQMKSPYRYSPGYFYLLITAFLPDLDERESLGNIGVSPVAIRTHDWRLSLRFVEREEFELTAALLPSYLSFRSEQTFRDFDGEGGQQSKTHLQSLFGVYRVTLDGQPSLYLKVQFSLLFLLRRHRIKQKVLGLRLEPGARVDAREIALSEKAKLEKEDIVRISKKDANRPYRQLVTDLTWLQQNRFYNYRLNVVQFNLQTLQRSDETQPGMSADELAELLSGRHRIYQSIFDSECYYLFEFEDVFTTEQHDAARPVSAEPGAEDGDEGDHLDSKSLSQAYKSIITSLLDKIFDVDQDLDDEDSSPRAPGSDSQEPLSE